MVGGRGREWRLLVALLCIIGGAHGLPCVDPKCDRCADRKFCTGCIRNYFLRKIGTKWVCTPCNLQNCRDCEPCLDPDRRICPIDHKCTVPINPDTCTDRKCDICKGNPNICTECVTNWYLKLSNAGSFTCSRCNLPNCKDCVPCGKNDPPKTCSGGRRCIQNTGTCADPKCALGKCPSNAAVCDKCVTNWYLKYNPVDRLYTCTRCNLPNCKDCVLCSQGEPGCVDGRKCTVPIGKCVDPKCNVCPKATECDGCIKNWYLKKNVAQNQFVCTPCNIANCADCQPCLTAGCPIDKRCTVCNTGFKPVNGQCVRS